MRPTSDGLARQLQQEVERHYPEWRLRDLTVIGQGLEALVFKATTDPFGEVAIKAPWNRFESNEPSQALN